MRPGVLSRLRSRRVLGVGEQAGLQHPRESVTVQAGEVKTRCWQRSSWSGCQSSAAAARRTGGTASQAASGSEASHGPALSTHSARRGVPGEQGVRVVGEPEPSAAADCGAAEVFQRLVEAFGMERAVPTPDDGGDACLVGLLGSSRTGRMLGGGGRLHVESCEGQPGELCGVGAHPTGGGVELGEKRTVLVVGVLALHDGEDGGVLQLPGPGVADRALVAAAAARPASARSSPLPRQGRTRAGSTAVITLVSRTASAPCWRTTSAIPLGSTESHSSTTASRVMPASASRSNSGTRSSRSAQHAQSLTSGPLLGTTHPKRRAPGAERCRRPHWTGRDGGRRCGAPGAGGAPRPCGVPGSGARRR